MGQSNIYFIGDTHFGHDKILTFEENGRQHKFSTIEEHDETLIDNWNKIVRNRDTVIHLGDVAFRNFHNVGRLRGYKKLILGNHDNEKLVGEYFDRMHGAVKVKYGKYKFLLTHIPIHPNEFTYRVDYNIHGHLHNGGITYETNEGIFNDDRYINLSADKINFTPIALEEILDAIDCGNL